MGQQQNGWIKYHRQILNNIIFRHDPTAWRIFEVLLLLSDSDGVWVGGRFQLADWCGLKPVTLYKAVQRLKMAKMVTLRSNNKYTTFSICNWPTYQQVGNNKSNNQVTTKEQQSNTLIRIKNKEREEELSTNVLRAKPNKGIDESDKRFGDPQINAVVEHFEKRIGKMPRVNYQRRAAKTLIQRYGFEKTIGAINAVVVSRGEQFAPTISTLVALRDKWVDLETFYKRTQTKKKGLKIV